MTPDTREQQKARTSAYEELKDQAKALADEHAKALNKDLEMAQQELQAKAPEKDRADDDDIARIERRMEARRESFRRHLTDARSGVSRTANAWPVVAVGAVIAAVAIGYVVARQTTSPTKRFAQRAREAPEAARRYIHRATRPSSAVWAERATKAAGFAVAAARVLPQLRALVAAFPDRRRPR